MSAEEGKKKERRGGKGGRGDGEGAKGRREGGKGEGGKGGKPRKPREELPMVDDPQAELDKLLSEPAPRKPDRDALEAKIANIQKEIDASKGRTDQITRELDAIKEKNERLKKQGSSGMEACRERLRDFKKQIVGVIEERKRISSSIDEIRAKKNEMDESIKKQRAAVGRFSSNESIDEEIKRIEEHMAHTSLTVKEEKEYIVQIKELNKKRDAVKQLEILEGKRGGGASKLSLPELFEARKAVDVRLNGLRDKEKAAVEELNTLREKSSSKDSDKFTELLEERKAIREKISDLIASIREKRSAHSEMDDKWYNHDRLQKNLKWQIRQKNIKEREARQKEWAEKNAGAEMPADEDDEEGGEPKEKMIDWDLAERIMLCEQLIVFLENYIPKEESKEEAVAAAVPVDGYTKEGATGAPTDDPLGLNAYMVDEVVSKQSKKKNKKKKHNAAKYDTQAALQEGPVDLTLSLGMIQNFTSMSLPIPATSEDAPSSLEQLKAKKDYYQTQGEAGLTLKEVLKKEKSDRKKENKDDSGKKDKKEEPAEKAAEEKKPEAKEAAAADKKDGPDWLAEKVARKLAEAPKVDEDLVAQLRAKAQSKAMTDEEKKARGLLYDTSKAKATRDESSSDEDDDAADFDGGDPFDGI